MKRAARFAVSSAAVEGAVALIGGAELHHMRNVLRLVPGAQVALFDERGAEYAGTIRKGSTDPSLRGSEGRESPSPDGL